MTIPGISRKVLTVGSSDDDTYDRGRKVLKTGYSGRGPTACCIVKPEILAPGTGITSCSKDKSGYQVKSGTSMAAPVVSGALALAFEKYPSFTPAEMKLRLYERAYPRSAQLGRMGDDTCGSSRALTFERKIITISTCLYCGTNL